MLIVVSPFHFFVLRKMTNTAFAAPTVQNVPDHDGAGYNIWCILWGGLQHDFKKKTLPKAQRIRGMSSYHKLLHKS